MARFERKYQIPIYADNDAFDHDLVGVNYLAGAVGDAMRKAGVLSDDVADIRAIKVYRRESVSAGRRRFDLVVTLIERASDIEALRERPAAKQALDVVASALQRVRSFDVSGSWVDLQDVSVDLEVQDPEVSPDTAFDGTRYSHPAFGQIGVSRVSGASYLYGSDFLHRRYVVLTLRTSELSRSLSSEKHFPDKAVVEVALSEAQWATLVSSFGVGEGVPCTIVHREGRKIPALPEPLAKVDVFKSEFSGARGSGMARLEGLLNELDQMGLPKAKAAAIKAVVAASLRDIQSSADFVATQFGKYAEGVIEAAKAEIHGYANGVIREAGLRAIAQNGPQAGVSPAPAIEYGPLVAAAEVSDDNA